MEGPLSSAPPIQNPESQIQNPNSSPRSPMALGRDMTDSAEESDRVPSPPDNPNSHPKPRNPKPESPEPTTRLSPTEPPPEIRTRHSVADFRTHSSIWNRQSPNPQRMNHHLKSALGSCQSGASASACPCAEDAEGCRQGRQPSQEAIGPGLIRLWNHPTGARNPGISRMRPGLLCRRSGSGRAVDRATRQVLGPRPALPKWSCPWARSDMGHGCTLPMCLDSDSSDT
jgi:hypothetical protein